MRLQISARKGREQDSGAAQNTDVVSAAPATPHVPARRSLLLPVVMSVFNGRRYLREAIDSILAQTFRDFEFVTVDDGSDDGSLAILQAYAQRDARVDRDQPTENGLLEAC